MGQGRWLCNWWSICRGHAGLLAKTPVPQLCNCSSLQELLQAKQDLQDLLIAKEEQEDLLRKRERELTALKGALKEEVSSHDQEMDKLKEQYDAELQALRESVEEATKVSQIPTEGVKMQPDKRLCSLSHANSPWLHHTMVRSLFTRDTLMAELLDF